jgi:hypothetical protein
MKTVFLIKKSPAETGRVERARTKEDRKKGDYSLAHSITLVLK